MRRTTRAILEPSFRERNPNFDPSQKSLGGWINRRIPRSDQDPIYETQANGPENGRRAEPAPASGDEPSLDNVSRDLEGLRGNISNAHFRRPGSQALRTGLRFGLVWLRVVSVLTRSASEGFWLRGKQRGRTLVANRRRGLRRRVSCKDGTISEKSRA